MSKKMVINEADYTKLYIYKMLERINSPALLSKIYTFIKTWIDLQEKEGDSI